jgi:DNA-binding MarR family transcriptional regulator
MVEGKTEKRGDRMDIFNGMLQASDNDLFSLGLDPFEFMIYVLLLQIVQHSEGKLVPSIRKIAAVCNMNKNTVERKIKSLEEKKLIRIHKYQNKNKYEILPVENIERNKPGSYRLAR